MTIPRWGSLLFGLSVGILSTVFAQPSQDTQRVSVGNPALRSELLAMEDRDQNIRKEWIRRLSDRTVDSSFVAKMFTVDSVNTCRVKEIVQHLGWPGISMVGKDGSEAVFLIVQHSPDTMFQRSCLPLVQAAYRDSQASGQSVALLTDRVLVREGKRQLYGSQAKIVDGKLVLDPIEDESNVDKRRATLGLPPMSDYLKLLRELYHLKE